MFINITIRHCKGELFQDVNARPDIKEQWQSRNEASSSAVGGHRPRREGPLRRGTPEKTGTGGGPCAWVGSASLPFSSILTRCTGDLAKVRVCCSFHFSINHLLTLQLSSLPSSLIIPGYLPLRLLK